MVKIFFETGDLCGPYKIVRLIGAGGFGQVFEAKCLATSTRVALKCIDITNVKGGELMDRLIQETEALQSLNHPNIVSIEDAGLNGGVFWIALEYIEGETLRERIRRGPIAIVTALGIAGQIADGSGAAHARNVVHRDLKPQNVMIAPKDEVKILDFGAAKIFGVDLTATGGIAPGTPLYMAPEQIKGERVDGRADIYALGFILYQMLAGKHPYASPSGKYPQLAEIAALHLYSSLGSISGVPDFVFDIISKATACDPARRFQSMQEVARAIRGALRRLMDDPAMVWARAPSGGGGAHGGGARVIELFPGRAKAKQAEVSPPPPAPVMSDASPPTLQIVAEVDHPKEPINDTHAAASDSDVGVTQKWIPALVVSRPDGLRRAVQLPREAVAPLKRPAVTWQRLMIVAPLVVVLLLIWSFRERTPNTSMEARPMPIIIAIPSIDESISHEKPAPPLPTRTPPRIPRQAAPVNSLPSSSRTATVHGEQVELCGVYYCQRKPSQ
ncbi:MAG: serine/threonine protein kinase [Polyangiaceae bacterium]|nr:serine/threonine protein kinase [Polyangiaceae bacterium]